MSASTTRDPVKHPIPFAPGWNEHRWGQLFELEKLLNEIGRINHGSDALGNIRRCIAMAENLQHDDVSAPVSSLVMFLKGRALGVPTIDPNLSVTA